MAMTNDEKYDLREQVRLMKRLGYSKVDAIRKIHFGFLFNKKTIAKYWESINGGSK